MISAWELIKARVARWSADGTALIANSGGRKSYAIPQINDPSIPILCVGGDHPYDQWYGDADDGLAKMYRDYGITPYLAINTATGAGAPGDTGFMTWAQLRDVAASTEIEVIGHAHRHHHQWGRIDTGIRIIYLGTNGTATVHISGSPKTLTLTAGASDDASFDLTNASYDTIGELVAAINAVNGGASWSCTAADELTGNERSTLLLALVSARSVKAGGWAEYFTAGSGIIVSYTGAAYKTAFLQRTSGNTLDIYLDGVRRLTYSLTSGSYDTLAEVVAAINAAAVTGLTANLCDDTGDPYEHYTQGDEKSTELVETLYLDITTSGGLVLDGNGGQANGARLNAGLAGSYLIDRAWQANKDEAAANDVALVNWAQSGANWNQWHLAGQNIWRSMRTNAAESNSFPGACWAATGPDYIRSYYNLASASLSEAQIKAAIDALVESPGAMMDMLCHALDPASPAGVNGYTLPASSSLNTVDENVWLAVLPHIKSYVDAGRLIVLTPEQARRRRKWAAKPQNMVFNSGFANDGGTMLGVASQSKNIPGWTLKTDDAHVTAASIIDGGEYNKVSFTANATTNADVLSCNLKLERGKTYRVGARIEIPSYSSGTGVYLVVSPKIGSLPGQLPDDASPTWCSALAKADQDISATIHVPAGGVNKPRVRGLVAGTFNIVSSSADTLSIAMDSYSAVAVTLTAGAARTASQVAADINAAFAASATYTGKQEYWTVASVQGNKVVIESPYAGEEYWNRITITGNATATVFGYAQCIAVPSYAPTGNPWVSMNMLVRGQMVGTWRVAQPYCVEINAAY